MIQVDNLTVKYKNIVAVDGISFNVHEGEIFGIIGPNGAGKTSTIECLEGLRKPAAGSISVFGINPVKDREILYKNIGVQLQEASFPDSIKVYELCELFSSLYGNPYPYKALLEKFELDGKSKSYLKSLSGGQKQRVSIVIALIADPKIIFLDELTSGLDPKSRKNMWEVIKQLKADGKTVVMTTHFMEEAEYLCDRVCMMTQGKIAAIGSAPQLIEQFNLNQKISFKAYGIDLSLIEKIDGVKKVSLNNGKVEILGQGKNLLKDIVVALSANNAEYDELLFTKPGLEDVYFNITGYTEEECV